MLPAFKTTFREEEEEQEEQDNARISFLSLTSQEKSPKLVSFFLSLGSCFELGFRVFFVSSELLRQQFFGRHLIARVTLREKERDAAESALVVVITSKEEGRRK